MFDGKAISETLMHWAPKVGLVFALLVGGLIVARLARKGTAWLVKKTQLDVLAERVGVPKLLYAVGVKDPIPEFMGRMVYYAVLLLTFGALAETLGLPGISEGINAIIGFLPRLVTAALIGGLGAFAADTLRTIITQAAARRGDETSPNFMAQAAYVLVLAVTATVAAEQIGIDTALIRSMIIVAVAAVLFGLSIGFALGSKGVFSQLVARYYVERMFRPGDTLTVGSLQGELKRYGAISAVLQTEDGEKVVPCSDLAEQAVGLQRKT